MQETQEIRLPDQDTAQEQSKRSRTKVAVVVAAIVVVVAVCGLVWWKITSAKALEAAREDYTVAVGAEKKSLEALGAVLEEAEGLSVDCVAKVADTGVCEELSGLLGKAKAMQVVKAVNAGQADRQTLDEAIKNVQANTGEADSVKKQLDAVVGKVKDSVRAKELAEAKQGVEGALSSAQAQVASTETLLSTSEGKVADEASRQAASNALGEVKALLDQAKNTEGLDAAKLNELAANLTDKTSALASTHAALQASHDAWQQSQQQAQAQAAASQAGSLQGRTSGSTSGARRGPGVSKPAAPATNKGPAPQRPRTGNSSGNNGGWVDNGWSGDYCFSGDSKGNSWAVPCP